MYTYRALNIVIGALLALAIASCSQKAADPLPVVDTPEFAASTFELTSAEHRALSTGDESALTVDFGDPALGATSFNAPPSPEQVASLQGSAMAGVSKSASCYVQKCKKHKKRSCNTCKEEKKCRKVTGICNRSERFWKVADCCSTTADVKYAAELSFDDQTGDLSGFEVVFSRDGVEVGRATTDKDGYAYFTDKAVARGPHSVRVCSAEVTTTTTTSSCSKCGSKDKTRCGCSKGSRSASCYTPCQPKCPPPPPPPPPCNCGKKDACEPCSSMAVDGFFCSSIDYAVYTDCISGAVTGTGYFPSCNPLRAGLRDQMNFRVAYDQGAVQGYLNYSAGQYADAPRIVNGQVKWLLITGVESWFGGDTFMVHVIDGGSTFTDDYFEIWINDPAKCLKYCCGGNLTGCYVHVSYKYTQKCP
jgi:hypothetical protein